MNLNENDKCNLSFLEGYKQGIKEGKKEGYDEGWEDFKDFVLEKINNLTL